MILYLSCTRLNNFANSIYIKGLTEAGEKVEAFFIEKSIRGYIDVIRKILSGNFEFLMIGYDSSRIVPVCRLFTRRKIVYVAILPNYERLILSRNLAGRRSPKGLYYRLIDRLAYACSDLVLLETNQQAGFVSRTYSIRRKRFLRAWTGVDGDNFFYEPKIEKEKDFTVLFRGAFMPEAGIEYIIRAAKLLEGRKINFLIFGGGLLEKEIKELVAELKPANLKLVTDFQTFAGLRKFMQKCHLSLGQLANHPRLSRTVPNKTFESLAMKIPYLTASNGGILELLTPGKNCLTCRPADARSLADRILWARDNRAKLKEVAENGYQLYKNELTSRRLAQNVLKHIRESA